MIGLIKLISDKNLTMKLFKYNGSGVDVENLKPLLIAKGNEKLKLFINKNLKQFKIKEAQISFPWNRMFEAEIDVSL